MSPGKQASQAGHAYLGAFLHAQQSHFNQATAYAAELPGTKVCLQGSLSQIEVAHAALQAAGIPSFLEVDSGCLNFFNGEPTVTALGFGPATKDEVKHITKKFKLL